MAVAIRLFKPLMSAPASDYSILMQRTSQCTRCKHVGNSWQRRWTSSQSENVRRQELMKKGLPKQKQITGVKQIVLVASGKGGVGKSTVAVNVALGLKKVTQKKIGLLDADIFGPSLPQLMNVHDQPDITKEKRIVPVNAYGIRCMSMGLLVKENAPIVWRGLIVMQAIQQLLFQVDWGILDVLVVDMPPGTGDVALSIIQNVPISGAIIVTTPQDLSLIDVRRGAEMFRKMNVPVIGLVQNMSYFSCPSCGHKSTIFPRGKLDNFTRDADLEILGEIPLREKICELSDLGKPVVETDSESIEAKIFCDISEKINCELESTIT